MWLGVGIWMDISKLTLQSFKRIVQDLIRVIENRNNHPNTTHLRTTASWLFHEDDESVFELLKLGAGGEYMREILEMGVAIEGNKGSNKKREEEDREGETVL